MIKLMDKKIIAILRSILLLNWFYEENINFSSLFLKLNINCGYSLVPLGTVNFLKFRTLIASKKGLDK